MPVAALAAAVVPGFVPGAAAPAALFPIPEVAPGHVLEAGARDRKMPARAPKAAEPVVVLRAVRSGAVLVAVDADRPAGHPPLAVALRGDTGWSVSTATGRLVGDRMDQAKAKALLLRTATAAANTLAVRLLLDRMVTA